MIDFKISVIKPPSIREKRALRLMILLGVISMIFFLYSILQKGNISNLFLYTLLMITMLFYCGKYLHEWYHYYSISANLKPLNTKIFTVDILTTYCAGEPFDMLEQTLIAIQNITYPHTAWCCDEANDPMVKQLCESLGVKHITRIIKVNAKAGNINNALQFASGELCLVLDPDHIPAPEFLDEVVSYFNDPSIGFVQVVQAYYNQTESLVAKGAAQQTYQFYGPMMMTMNSYGTVQAIGANCTFRRAALDSIGGHASGLSEDMHTAMQLHAKGWRSVYVPAILTRGLVPATISSYFKQQLKWSRGTWELLMVTYPKLFTKFTWRQKIHYFTLPFHYLSGFIFFINFLIPVVSLFTGYIPLKMDLFNFLLAAFPIFAMAVFIRHFVQKWVAEENDRGFHFVGGILQIGAWWIHTLGFVYTLLRKKVPYIPTPKNDHDPLPFLWSLPNIIIALISLIAIFYGIWHDFNPYTLFMILLAFMQILFMFFIFSISGYVSDDSKVNKLAAKLKAKDHLIISMHGFLRRYSLPLSFVLVIVFILAYRKQQELPSFLPTPVPELSTFYRGIFQQTDTGSNKIIRPDFSINKRKDIAIISLNMPFKKDERNNLDTTVLEQIYNLHAVPLLVWKPFQKDWFTNDIKDSSIFRQILAGKYDRQINSFANQIALLNKPVFLNYITEQSQNKYPVADTTKCCREDYIAAWQYVHRQFDKAGADKVIWIWTAAETLSPEDFFPGNSYVDWLGVDIASNDTGILQSELKSFDSLYRPYHRSSLFTSGFPVIITNTDANTFNTTDWWNTAWKNMDTCFTEIRSVIAGTDNYSAGRKMKAFQNEQIINSIFSNAPSPSAPLEINSIALPNNRNGQNQYKLPGNIKSIVYNKGYYWFRNRHTLNLDILEGDIAEIKKIGINTIERSMPGFYDYKIEKVLVANKINLIPRFTLLTAPDEIANDEKMQLQKEKIISLVKNNLHKQVIIAWNLGEDVLFSLGNQTYKPNYFYYQQKYTKWLQDVCQQIRLIDTIRPIIMDLQWDAKGAQRFKFYKKNVPQINKYMLIADSKYKRGLNDSLEKEMAWGKVEVALWPLLPAIKNAGTVPAWQDIENTKFILLNGLLDMDGRRKDLYSTVMNTWGNGPIKTPPIPVIKILKDSKITQENTRLFYNVIYEKEKGRWTLYKDDGQDIHFEWYLVRIDKFGNTMFIKKAGEGSTIALTIPAGPEYYELYVEAVLGKDVKMVHTSLNTHLN